MNAQKLLVVLTFAAIALPLQVQADGPIEPNAGNWRTWVISSGRDYRVLLRQDRRKRKPNCEHLPT